jgi:hypothetical protein
MPSGERREMKEDLDSAERYRQRAEELRVIAEATKDIFSKKALIDIAADYDRMAIARERIDAREPSTEP